MTHVVRQESKLTRDAIALSAVRHMHIRAEPEEIKLCQMLPAIDMHSHLKHRDLEDHLNKSGRRTATSSEQRRHRKSRHPNGAMQENLESEFLKEQRRLRGKIERRRMLQNQRSKRMFGDRKQQIEYMHQERDVMEGQIHDKEERLRQSRHDRLTQEKQIIQRSKEAQRRFMQQQQQRRKVELRIQKENIMMAEQRRRAKAAQRAAEVEESKKGFTFFDKFGSNVF